MSILRLKHFLVFITIACLTYCVSSCQKSKSAFNFIFITLDTQRADHLSSYNPANASTPHLDSLAKKSILFENCYSVIPITLPAHTAMFYSLQPYEMHIYNNGDKVIHKQSRPSFVEIFRKNGFRTAAFVSLGVLQPKFGLDEGFNFYSGKFPRNGSMFLTAGEVNREVLPWLEQNKDKKFFLWVHYSDPHNPYYPPHLLPELTVSLNHQSLGEYHLNRTVYRVPMTLRTENNIIRLEINIPYIPKPTGNKANFMRLAIEDMESNTLLTFKPLAGLKQTSQKKYYIAKKRSKFLIENPDKLKHVKLIFQGNLIVPKSLMRKHYAQEVEYMDEQFGILMQQLERLRLLDKTHIVIIGDHGEGLGDYMTYREERDFGHINFLYDIYTRVPLIIYSPKAPERGLRKKEPVDLLDLAPTIMFMAGLKPPHHFRGRNLFELNTEDSHRIFQATYRPQADQNKFGILKYPWHLISTPTEKKYELFNLFTDHSEQNSLFEDFSQDEKIIALKQTLDREVRKILKNKSPPKIDKKTEEMLKALGYIK